MGWKRLVLLSIAFNVYLAIGGLVFSKLEADGELETRVDVRGRKESILLDLDCLTEERLEDLIEHIMKAVRAGIDPRQNLTSKSHWDFSSSFFFSGTVVTTIGYGRLAPSTRHGQNFCIVYALIGIPLLGWLLSVVGEFYRDSFRKLTDGLDHLLQDYCSVTSRQFRRIVMWLIVASISYCVLVLIPAALFTILEDDWSYREAHYYCFITLTTIGFGDYVATADSKKDPPEELEVLYDIAVVFWYIFGLSFFAVVISTIGTHQVKAVDKLECSIKNHTIKDNTYTLNHQHVEDEEGVQFKVKGGIVGPIRYQKPRPAQCVRNPADEINEKTSAEENNDQRECSEAVSESMATATTVLPRRSSISTPGDAAIKP